MVHGDQKGLVLPPKIAPIQIVIIPIYKGDDKKLVDDALKELHHKLNEKFRIHIDSDPDTSPGAKFYNWELKGVPVRIEIGPRDIVSGQVVIADRISGQKKIVSQTNLIETIEDLLHDIQKQIA